MPCFSTFSASIDAYLVCMATGQGRAKRGQFPCKQSRADQAARQPPPPTLGSPLTNVLLRHHRPPTRRWPRAPAASPGATSGRRSRSKQRRWPPALSRPAPCQPPWRCSRCGREREGDPRSAQRRGMPGRVICGAPCHPCMPPRPRATPDEVVHRLLLGQLGNRRQHAKGVAAQHDDVLGVAAHARDLGVLCRAQRVGTWLNRHLLRNLQSAHNMY